MADSILGKQLREVIINRGVGWNLVIPITVEKEKTEAIIDTAAQATVVSERIFKLIKDAPPVKETVVLKGVTEDSSVVAQYVEGLEIQVGRKRYKWNILVAPITDNFILGLDFLKQQKGVVNLESRELVLDKEVIALSIKKSSEDKSCQVCRVSVAKRIVLPPQSTRVVKVKTERPIKDECCFSPTERKNNDIISPNVYYSEGIEKEFRIQVTNVSDKYHTLKKNVEVGSCVEAQLMEEMDMERVQVRKMEYSENQTSAEVPEHLSDLYQRSVNHLSEEESKQLAKLLTEFQDVFAVNDTDLGMCTVLKHRIDTGDAKPVQHRLRRTPIGFEAEEEQHLKSMLANGVIEPSTSEWAASPVLVRKRDGSVRYCIDYRDLNDRTVDQNCVIPTFSQCVDFFFGLEYMSTLDLQSGYWQIQMDERDKEKTAFLTKYGQFQYRKMPFGLKNAPCCFTRAITLILQGLLWHEVLAYLDDIFVLGKSFSHHLENLKKVFERFRKYNMKFKPKKCALFQKSVVFLGKEVSQEGTKVTEETIDKVRDWPTPKCIRDVESFLGFANYSRDHIPNFAEISGALYELTGSKATFHWERKHGQAFSQLKEVLINPPVLSFPSKDGGSFILDCDASNYSVGGCLSQLQDGVEKVIAYSSFVLAPYQRRYCTTRKELLAVVRLTRQFRHYLLGKKFIVRTDHNSLIWLMRFRYIEGQLARWLEELSQYSMHIIHRAGKKHLNADALSRMPDDLVFCSNYEAEKKVEDLPCGGCKFCKRAHEQWERFEEEVDYFVPLCVRSIIVDGLEGVSAKFKNEDLAKLQRDDLDLSKLIQWVEQEEKPPEREVMKCGETVKFFWLNFNLLVMQNGVLYYKWLEDNVSRFKLIVPDSLKSEVLKGCHDFVMAGHVGMNNTLQNVKRSFIWHGMTKDVSLYVKSCPVCSRNKKSNKRAKAPLMPFHAGCVMERIHMDILGPFPRSVKGNVYVLMVVDQFTKWVEAYAIPDQSAETIVDKVVAEFFSRFGFPLQIHTDQGRNFDGTILREFCEVNQVKKTRTSPYRPCSNGQVERYNRTLVQMIRCYIDKDQKEWDVNLPYLTAAIRAIVNRQVGFTANLMMLGRETNVPIDILLGVASANQEESSSSEYVNKLVKQMRDMHQFARESIEACQERQKRDYDVKLVENSFQKGDIVLEIESGTIIGKCKKLKNIWKGPYVISKVINSVLFEIAGQKKTRIVHHDRLKLCEDRSMPLWITRKREEILRQDLEDEDENEDYEEKDGDLGLEKYFGENRSGAEN